MKEWIELLDFLKKPETKNFIRENINADISKLLLNPPSSVAPFVKEVAEQIWARQKGKKKLDSWVSNFDLIFPPPISVEQASSDQTAGYKKSIYGGDHLVDLTGGMGVDTLALSERFKKTSYIDQQELLVEIFKHNCEVFGKKIEASTGSAESYLARDFRRDEVLSFYLDPARRDEAKNKVFNLEDCSPNIIELQPQLKKLDGNVLVKLSPFLDIKLILGQLRNIKEVHIVSIKNECKEVLILIDYSFNDEPEIKTINLDRIDQSFDFKFSDEEKSLADLSTSKKYVLEPNASILKAGAFNKIAVDFAIEKLHPNTHLYTAENLIPKWPGRMFEVIENDVSKQSMSHYAPNGYINVMARNYPLSPFALKKKFKIQDGGAYFLIGFADADNKNNLVIARKVNPTIE